MLVVPSHPLLSWCGMLSHSTEAVNVGAAPSNVRAPLPYNGSQRPATTVPSRDPWRGPGDRELSPRAEREMSDAGSISVAHPFDLWTRGNAGEVLAGVVSPLTWSINADILNQMFSAGAG